MRRIGKYYSSMLIRDILKDHVLAADYVVPVPLHISKKRERGYNQSDLICDGVSDVLKIESLKKCLKRKRFTRSQTKLTREERQSNVKDAFEVRKKYKEIIRDKNIILVDDVITTGSTILECARVLKENDCRSILICSLALAE
jgi:ComF family protein